MTYACALLVLLATAVPSIRADDLVLNATGLCDGTPDGLVTDYVLSVYAEDDDEMTNQLDIEFEVRTEFPDAQEAVENDWHVTIYYNAVQRLNTTETSSLTDLENGNFTEAEVEVEVEDVDYEANVTAVFVAMAMNKTTSETCMASITDMDGVLTALFEN